MRQDAQASGRFIIGLSAATVVAAVLWLVLARVVVPPVIESAYRGESLPFLNAMITGQADYPVEHHLSRWDAAQRAVLWMLVVTAMLVAPLAWARRAAPPWLRSRAVLLNAVLAGLAVVALVVLPLVRPVAYVHLVIEDSWLEYLTFATFGVATVLLAWGIRTYPSLRRPGYILIALATLFVAMEEISWGQRIVGFGTPALLERHNLQGEMTLHNLVLLPRVGLMAPAIIAWIVILPVAVAYRPTLQRWCDAIGIPLAPAHLVPWLAAAVPFYLPPLISRHSLEIAEAFLGVAMAGFALELTRRAAVGRDETSCAAPLGAAALAAYCTIPTLCLVLIFNDSALLRDELNAFASRRRPETARPAQARMIFAYLREHPEMQRPETPLAEARLLLDMGLESEAHRALDHALTAQASLRSADPHDPSPDRVSGEILLLLGRATEADTAFDAAIGKDQTRLTRANEREAKVPVHISLARTRLAMGDRRGALLEYGHARALTNRESIRRWIDLELAEVPLDH